MECLQNYLTQFEVLESARALFNVGDATPFQLTHRTNAIDLALPFRLTGISNNATLEMRPAATSATPDTVRVGVQLPDGKRVQHAFAPDTMLDAMLRHFQLLPSPFSVRAVLLHCPHDTKKGEVMFALVVFLVVFAGRDAARSAVGRLWVDVAQGPGLGGRLGHVPHQV